MKPNKKKSTRAAAERRKLKEYAPADESEAAMPYERTEELAPEEEYAIPQQEIAEAHHPLHHHILHKHGKKIAVGVTGAAAIAIIVILILVLCGAAAYILLSGGSLFGFQLQNFSPRTIQEADVTIDIDTGKIKVSGEGLNDIAAESVAAQMVSRQYAIAHGSAKKLDKGWEFDFITLPWDDSSSFATKYYRISGASLYRSYNVTILLPPNTKLIRTNDGCMSDADWMQLCMRAPYSSEEECRNAAASENICKPPKEIRNATLTGRQAVLITSQPNGLSAEVIYGKA